ncbi:hypothetical protein EPA93_44840 [Ktedonosporobacter rubrisoli]|uniref:Uncharacterized protein n=1 Tax=Ktedonosporobacter rubrisoli TaxID=2509675 RepID=A0A4P6K4G2_KTERU|nr:hypothetical protein [Ktedonosporobacter rubrisoli]QBD82720.1 hypothetical protein EPA93_44840 [Ktedonosporobacter rubrisoli]
MLADGAQMAAEQGARGAERAGYIGAMLAWATLLGNLSFLLPNALTTGYLALGNLIFTVYPLLLGAFATFVMMIAVQVLPWRAAATSVTVVYLLFGLVNYLLIPLLMTLNLQLEQQYLLPHASTVSLIGLEWQYGLLIPAVLLDAIAWLTRRAKWPPRRANRVTFVVASISISLAALLYPFFIRSAQEQSDPLSKMNGPIAAAQLQASSNLPHSSIVLVIALSLLLGLLGIWGGSWLGAGIGELMRRTKR